MARSQFCFVIVVVCSRFRAYIVLINAAFRVSACFSVWRFARFALQLSAAFRVQFSACLLFVLFIVVCCLFSFVYCCLVFLCCFLFFYILWFICLLFLVGFLFCVRLVLVKLVKP